MTHLPGMAPEDSAPDWLRDRIQKCRSCGAPIVFAMTRVDGPRTMPVDPVPTPRGNVELVLDRGTLRAYVHGRNTEWDGGMWHTSHFATCPDAAKHRRKR